MSAVHYCFRKFRLIKPYNIYIIQYTFLFIRCRVLYVLVAPGVAGTGRVMDRATVMVTDRVTVMVTVMVMGQANLPSSPTSSGRRGLGSSPLKPFFSFKTSKFNFYMQ